MALGDDVSNLFAYNKTLCSGGAREVADMAGAKGVEQVCPVVMVEHADDLAAELVGVAGRSRGRHGSKTVDSPQPDGP